MLGSDVILVPPAHKKELLQKRDSALIEAEDHETWVAAPEDLRLYLAQFLLQSSKSWNVRAGTRFGRSEEGFFVQEHHNKRFFGLERVQCSFMLLRDVPQALPKYCAKAHAEDKTLEILDSLTTAITDGVSDNMRHQVLRVAFRSADENGNGTLSKAEIARYIRRVVPVLSSRNVDEIMSHADINDDGRVSYEEFVNWLGENASLKIRNALQKSIVDESDIIRATFRSYDHNGDGLIKAGELKCVVTELCPEMSTQQMKVMFELMDSNQDDMVDYDEFVDFLFGSKKPVGHP
eukprot:TRINITY_DN74385_c0_g1_i1.p1 TRINITY_DN74385_c0_g1~~TRINITY_DN74385_c0_g1_i1.p1  ORF type:complete len:303 (+),score=48.55 TRINITY_DN74385_c0_g1_i1:34-909(+)